MFQENSISPVLFSPTTRLCAYCRQWKAADEFGEKKSGELKKLCFECDARTTAYRKANKDRLRVYSADYYAANKESMLAQQMVRYNAADPKKRANLQSKRHKARRIKFPFDYLLTAAKCRSKKRGLPYNLD